MKRSNRNCVGLCLMGAGAPPTRGTGRGWWAGSPQTRFRALRAAASYWLALPSLCGRSVRNLGQRLGGALG